MIQTHDNVGEVFLEERINTASELKKFEYAVERVSHYSEVLQIEDEATCRVALDLAAEVKKYAKEIEAIRKKGIQPSRKLINFINDVAKWYQEVLIDTENRLKMKVALWQKASQEKADAQKEAIKKLQAELGIEISISNQTASTSFSTPNIIASSKMKYDFEIKDEIAVPREYLSVDEKKVKTAISMGVQCIPGIEIKQEKVIVMRSR